MQAEAPDPAANAPAPQLAHEAAAAPEYVPATQLAQLDEALPPTVSRNRPAGHAVQLDAPAVVWYEPARHLEQAILATMGAYEPTAQLEQVNAPVADKYVPDGHAVQTAIEDALIAVL